MAIMKYDSSKSSDDKAPRKNVSYGAKYSSYGSCSSNVTFDLASVALQSTKRRRYMRRGSKAPSMFYGAFSITRSQDELERLEMIKRRLAEERQLLAPSSAAQCLNSRPVQQLPSNNNHTAPSTAEEESRILPLKIPTSLRDIAVPMGPGSRSQNETRTLRRSSLTASSENLRPSSD
mmetsp:Transcript_19853/g.33888  ORF Transcript_19853/g.33888 Transcript_19853/m.33888 type:complete len:177 (-) Transcript_19853:80-610(-)